MILVISFMEAFFEYPDLDSVHFILLGPKGISLVKVCGDLNPP